MLLLKLYDRQELDAPLSLRDVFLLRPSTMTSCG
jgi:hypothetical protein